MFGSPVRDLHVELTSRCTLMCPRCQRNSDPAELSVQDLDLRTIRAALTRDNFPSARFINLCGGYGDPIYHREFHAVLRHLKGQGFEIRLIRTAAIAAANGGKRPLRCSRSATERRFPSTASKIPTRSTG